MATAAKVLPVTSLTKIQNNNFLINQVSTIVFPAAAANLVLAQT